MGCGFFCSIGSRTLKKQEFGGEELASRRNADPRIDIPWTLYVDHTFDDSSSRGNSSIFEEMGFAEFLEKARNSSKSEEFYGRNPGFPVRSACLRSPKGRSELLLGQARKTKEKSEEKSEEKRGIPRKKRGKIGELPLGEREEKAMVW